MSFRELLRDPEARGWVLLVTNLVGGFLGSKLSLRQVRDAAERAVAPVREAVQALAARVSAVEKFPEDVERFPAGKVKDHG